MPGRVMFFILYARYGQKVSTLTLMNHSSGASVIPSPWRKKSSGFGSAIGENYREKDRKERETETEKGIERKTEKDRKRQRKTRKI